MSSRIDERPCLKIPSPCIHMDGCRLPPECSLQNNNTTLINCRDPSASEESHPIAPYKFFGTRSICAITVTRYWQVKLVVQSAAMASLVNKGVFAEYGVASSTALDAADSNIDGDFSVMVRHQIKCEEPKGRYLLTQINDSSTDGELSGRQSLDEGMDLVCRLGFLVHSSMRRLTILDIAGENKIYEGSFKDEKLYAAFNILKLKDSVGGDITVSVETGGQMRLSHKLAVYIAGAVGSNQKALDSKIGGRSTGKDASTVAGADAAVNSRKKTPASNARTEPDLTGNTTTADDQNSGRKRKDVASGEEREPGASGSAPQMNVSVAGLPSTTSVARAHTSLSTPTSGSTVESRSQRGRGGEDTESPKREEHTSTADDEGRKRYKLRKRGDRNEAGFQNVPAKQPKGNSSFKDS